ncbi:unnamed protein product [Rotaria sp. Silwood1]|nr:unnamed protein product [Rotaria sp. Silwood1]
MSRSDSFHIAHLHQVKPFYEVLVPPFVDETSEPNTARFQLPSLIERSFTSVRNRQVTHKQTNVDDSSDDEPPQTFGHSAYGSHSNSNVIQKSFKGNSTVNMMRWSLRKAIDNKCTNVSKFSNNCNVKSRVPVRITARNTSKRESIMTRRDGETILIADTIPTWGVGKHATTQLIDDRGNEQAIYIQKFA